MATYGDDPNIPLNYEMIFIKYLSAHGYPKNKILNGFAVTKLLHVDVVVFDKNATAPIAFFEIKSGRLSIERINRVVKYFKDIIISTGLNVPCYLVRFLNEEKFQIFDLTDYINYELPTSTQQIFDKEIDLPAYETQTMRVEVKNKIKRQIDSKKKIDALKIFSWVIIPLVSILLQVLDSLGIYEFNTERLIILGATVIIALLPFFSEISFKDFSVKREKEKKEDKESLENNDENEIN